MGNVIKATVLNRFIRPNPEGIHGRSHRPEGLHEIKDLIESGRMVPVIGRTFPLTEAAAAVDLVEKGSPPGKVVVLID